MDEVDHAQEIMERESPKRGKYFPDRFNFTEATPYAAKADDIPIGGRGSPNGVLVYFRHACGRLVRLGRPPDGGTLDDPQFVDCPYCHRP